jgi:tetratricopeptide (TPR) repeat protein
MALALRERGNSAFLLSQFATAEAFYSQALRLTPADASLLANRAAARAGQQQWELALQDAVTATELDAGHAKGWFRRAEAASALGRHAEAVAALEQGLVAAPLNRQLLEALAAARERAAAAPAGACWFAAGGRYALRSSLSRLGGRAGAW